MDDYVTKPMNRERLEACLAHLLKDTNVARHELEAAGTTPNAPI
jgi:DNA-binding response OmpR family regulator